MRVSVTTGWSHKGRLGAGTLRADHDVPSADNIQDGSTYSISSWWNLSLILTPVSSFEAFRIVFLTVCYTRSLIVSYYCLGDLQPYPTAELGFLPLFLSNVAGDTTRAR